MLDKTKGCHHIEIHTIQPENILDLFQRVYDFQLIAKRTTQNYSQWFLQSSQCRIIISSILNVNQNNQINDNDDYDILTSIFNNPLNQDLILNRDTVFNVALHVKSIQSILDQNSDLQVLVSPRQATDEHGSIEYACIKSCIGNVVHTLINTSQYSGVSLPGFIPVSSSGPHQRLIKSIDHIAFAMSKNSSLPTMVWYEKVFGLQRFFLNQEDDPFQGFSVRVGTRGMRLFANDYWKCSENACVHENSSNFKFVFAESLIDDDSNSSDQITTFISSHQNQAGLQHIGFFCIKDIKETVRITQINGAQFLSPCLNYYLTENNGHVIEAAGESAADLAELGILLDNESENSDESTKKILLQIFTKSIFNNDTFFLELIERRGATGFGAGNIRALWKSIQQKLDHQN